MFYQRTFSDLYGCETGPFPIAVLGGRCCNGLGHPLVERRDTIFAIDSEAP